VTDLLEHVLHDTLRRRAAQLDQGAATRVLAFDYRPRRSRVSAVSILGATGLGITAALLTIVLELGSTAPPAFARWTAAPSRAAPGQTTAALRQCRFGSSPVLTDTRGPYTAAVYAVAGGIGTCLSGGSLSFTSTAGGPAVDRVGAGQIQPFVSGSVDASGRAFTILDGRVGADVTGVTIERPGHPSVVATVARGWYLAWWPDARGATAARVTTASGIRETALPIDGLPAGTACSAAGVCGGASFASSPAAPIGSSAAHPARASGKHH
jgi:hypothetical protein